MARSLYGRLFRYTVRQNRTPLENFLTEALADILNRLPIDEVTRVLREVLLADVGPGQRAATLDLLVPEADWVWATQHRISHGGSIGYADLVLLVRGRPALLVENKVAAGFTTHEERVDNGNAVLERDQLNVYGQWLARENSAAGLVLLTHASDPPEDFLKVDADYGVATRRVCRWRRVYQWLASIDKMPGESTSVAGTLAQELARFLEDTEETMGVNDPGPLELSLVQAYYRLAHTRFVNAMTEIGRFVKDRYPEGSDLNRQLGVSPEGLRLYGYYRLKPRVHHPNWYVAWGVLLPGSQPWPVDLSQSLPGHEAAFVLATSDGDDFPAHLVETARRPQGWLWPGRAQQHYGPVKTRPLSDFYASPRGFTDEFKVWLKEPCLDEALAIFDAVPRTTLAQP